MEVKPGFKLSEAGAIPKDWEVKSIHDIAVVKTGPFGTLLKAAEYSKRSGVPLISVGEIRNGFLRVTDHTPRVSPTVVRRLPQFVLKKGDIVFGRKGGVERSALIRQEQDGWFLGSDGIGVRPKRDCCHEYLAFQFQTRRVREWLLQNAIGTTMPSLNQDIIRRVLVSLPPTTVEQEAIAEALSDADALIESLEQLIAKKRQVKQGAMQELLTGKRRLPGFDLSGGAFKQTQIGVIPEEWDVRPLLSTVIIATGQVDPRNESYRSMILVAPDHIESRTGRLIEKKSAADQQAISGKYLFNPGDIVYSKIRPYLRKAVIADFQGLCSADMYPLSPVSNVNARYILAILLGHHFSTFAETVSVRSGMPKINREELAQYRFALPQLAEQTAVASILNDMDAEIDAIDSKLAKARQIKQGMMQELLTGRIRLI